MELRGIKFQPVFDASGARNFDGSGWWYHQYLHYLGLDFTGSTFVAKTTTYDPRPGNMQLQNDGITPLQKFPDCVKINFLKGAALNAVGLSGPGAAALLNKNIWQQWPEPFFVSFMAVRPTKSERLDETKKFIELLASHQNKFTSKFGLQLNLSCPNVGSIAHDDFLKETEELLRIANQLNIPLIPKLSITTPTVIATSIAQLTTCDALCVSNTLPWGSFPDKVNWKNIFGTSESPLKKYGGGGLSGAPLLPLVESWIKDATSTWKIKKPIQAGGGILKASDVDRMKNAGASSIFVGSVAFLRPWNIRSIIKRAHEIF